MKIEDEGICIYCKRQGSSREHVAPASIGGNCVIRCVCRSCNTNLSSADKGLAEHSPVTFTKIANTPTSSFETQLGGYASFESEDAGTVTVRVGNQMKPDVRPQFRLIGNQLRGVAKDLDSLNMLIAFIEKQVAKGRLSSTRIQVNGGESYPHFCMHRSDDAVVSCSSEQDGVRLLKLLEVEWPQIKAGFENVPIQMKSSTPEINIKMKFKPNDEFRGAAKIAFETAAHLLGVEVVLGEEFDPVRSYICGNLVLPVVNVEMGEIAVDTRFVKRLGDEFTLRFTTKHGVLLLSSPPNLIAFVLLYGTHPYFVHLSKKWVDNLWFRVYEFSHTKDGHQELDELEFARRILSTSPATFGISDEAAKELLEQLRS